MSSNPKKSTYSTKAGRVNLPMTIRRAAYRKLLELRVQKNSMEDIAELFHKEYGVSPRTVKGWWTKRTKWEKDILDIPDAQQIAKDMVFERDLIKKHLWIEALHPDNPAIRHAALKALLDANPDSLQVMHDLGLITKQPESIRFLTDDQVMELVEIVNIALKDEHPEAQQKLIEALKDHERSI